MGTVRTLHIVTHSEATHHVERRVGGWFDSALTAQGVRDAGAIAGALRGAVPEGAEVELFSSDLLRTRQTADAIAETFGVAVVHDPRLREKSYGEAGGRPQEWLDRRFVPPPAAGERLEHDEGIEGAETKAQWVRRVYEATEDILRRPARQQIVVTHGGTLTFVLAAWIGMPYEATGYVSFRAPAGSITTLREDDWFHNRQIAALGDTRHLLNPAASP